MSSKGDVNAFSRISQAFSDKFLGGKTSLSLMSQRCMPAFFLWYGA